MDVATVIWHVEGPFLVCPDKNGPAIWGLSSGPPSWETPISALYLPDIEPQIPVKEA